MESAGSSNQSVPPYVLHYADQMFRDHEETFLDNPAALVEQVRHAFPENVRRNWTPITSPLAAQYTDRPVLVRARCMVQDFLGAECYAASCEILEGGKKRNVSGALRDSYGGEELEITKVHHLASRYCYVMVEVPGCTEWFAKDWEGETKEEKKEECEDGESESKKAKMATPPQPVTSFVAKFTDEAAEGLKTNAVLEVYGILSAHKLTKEMEDESTTSPTNIIGLPNLHVIHYEPFSGALLSPETALAGTAFASSTAALSRLRSVLLECIGDGLAADYMAMHLLSTTYSRKEIALASLPLNVCGVRHSQPFIDIVETLMPRIRVLPMTSAALSNDPFHSSKDYESNRLMQGVFQVAHGTCLIMDELATPTGQRIDVRDHAERNLSTLSKVISEQKIDYDFGFYSCTFDVDISVMVLSEERSRFMNTPYRVCVPPFPSPSSSPLRQLTKDELRGIRMAIMHAKATLKDVSISADIANAVKDAFVHLCCHRDYAEFLKGDNKAEILSRSLLLARLVTALRGETAMTLDAWLTTMRMEKRREQQVDELFPVPVQETKN